VPTWTKPHVSYKAGPNGKALASTHIDVQLLNSELVHDLKTVAQSSDFDKMLDTWIERPDRLLEINESFLPGGEQLAVRKAEPALRRLSVVDSPEGKKRVIAIFDYWSQDVLKPVHDWTFRILRRIPMDMTFDQSRDIESFPLYDEYHSLDLTAATDRVPISIQEILLAQLLGEERASAWKRIMIGKDFIVPFDNVEGLKRADYAVGQPMGAYSSWSVFTLTHHLIVQWAAYRFSKSEKLFDTYRILGDDIVIGHSGVANEYMKILNELGVEINLQKTMRSPYMYEFAKRLIVHGKEVTPLPVNAIMETVGNLTALWSTSIVCAERGYHFHRRLARHGALLAHINVDRQLKGMRLLTKSQRFRISQYIRYADAIEVICSAEEEIIYQVNWLISFFRLPYSCTMSEETRVRNVLTLVSYAIYNFKMDKIQPKLAKFRYLRARLEDVDSFETYAEGARARGLDPVDASLSPITRYTKDKINEIAEMGKELEALYSDGGPTPSPQLIRDMVRRAARPEIDAISLVSRRTDIQGAKQYSEYLVSIRKFLVESNMRRSQVLSEPGPVLWE
jgi:hypothetical protein